MTLDDDDDNILLNDNSNEDNSQDEETRLAIKDKLTSEDIAFVIKTMKKEAPYDMQSIKQLFYGMSTVFTKVQSHIILIQKMQEPVNHTY